MPVNYALTSKTETDVVIFYRRTTEILYVISRLYLYKQCHMFASLQFGLRPSAGLEEMCVCFCVISRFRDAISLHKLTNQFVYFSVNSNEHLERCLILVFSGGHLHVSVFSCFKGNHHIMFLCIVNT